MVDPALSLADRKQQVELLVRRLIDVEMKLELLTGGITTATALDGAFVMHGDTVGDDFDNAKLHRDMTGEDLHWPKTHGDRHDFDGLDPLNAGIPVQVGSANAQGAGPEWALFNHVHQSRYTHVWQETPVGVIDGANNTFTFASVTKSFSYDASEIPQVNDWHRVYYVYDGGVIDDDSIMVFKNGVLYLDGLGITLSVPAGGGFASLLGHIGI